LLKGHVIGLCDSLDPAGHIDAGSCALRFAQAGHEPADIRPASHQAPVERIDGSGMNSDQNFIVAGRWLLDLFTLR